MKNTLYVISYNKISTYIDTHNFLYKLLKLLYKLLPWISALSYVYLLVRQAGLMMKGQVADVANSTNATDILTCAKLVLTPLTVFIVITVLRKCIDAKRPYELYDIKPLIAKGKKGESMPSRHVLSAGIIAMSWLYVNLCVGIIMWVCTLILAVVRVIAGVHFPRDVIAAMIIAAMWGYVGLWVM